MVPARLPRFAETPMPEMDRPSALWLRANPEPKGCALGPACLAPPALIRRLGCGQAHPRIGAKHAVRAGRPRVTVESESAQPADYETMGVLAPGDVGWRVRCHHPGGVGADSRPRRAVSLARCQPQRNGNDCRWAHAGHRDRGSYRRHRLADPNNLSRGSISRRSAKAN